MLLWILWILALIVLVWIVWSIYAVKWIEKPKYDILETRSWYELREYRDYIVAQVEVEWDREEAVNQGFRTLAGYIFGWNQAKESISMTAPVNDIEKSSVNISMTAPVNDIETSKNIHLVQFVLPSKYTLKTLPIPNDERVQLKKVDWYTAAAISYTMWATQERVEKYKKKLKDYVESDKLRIVKNPISAQYNPPLSFPLLRRNEIIAEVR